MKKSFEIIKPISEISILIFIFFLPNIINLYNILSTHMELTINMDNWIFYLFYYYGNNFSGLILSLVTWWFIIRNANKNSLFNAACSYHNYPYWWYWICSKFLCYKKCNLINVPIYMQFKLVLNATFEDYPLDDKEFPERVENSIVVETRNLNNIKAKEVNLVLEDTYGIKNSQLPENKKRIYTIKISRTIDNNSTRYYSPEFINKIVEVIGKLDDGIKVNVFATTNPKNTMFIIKKAFGTANNRSGITGLTVFQQENNNGIRLFNPKGIIIY